MVISEIVCTPYDWMSDDRLVAWARYITFASPTVPQAATQQASCHFYYYLGIIPTVVRLVIRMDITYNIVISVIFVILSTRLFVYLF
jgi:hypothetical protein